jgi:5-formyltetrahydrofolate cyclo-ligase
MSSSQAMLRQQGRLARESLLPEYRQSASQTIVAWLKNHLSSVKSIAIYLPIGFEISGARGFVTEVDLSELLPWAWAHQKQICVPLVRGDQLIFVSVTPNTEFQKNRWNILEPIATPVQFEKRQGWKSLSSLERGINDIEVICLPLVAFDEALHRIGQGKGFYDRALASCRDQVQRPRLIGCAFDCQKVSRIFPQPHDVRLDTIVTEKRVYGGDSGPCLSETYSP